jgi:hypothetical protein
VTCRQRRTGTVYLELAGITKTRKKCLPGKVGDPLEKHEKMQSTGVQVCTECCFRRDINKDRQSNVPARNH